MGVVRKSSTRGNTDDLITSLAEKSRTKWGLEFLRRLLQVDLRLCSQPGKLSSRCIVQIVVQGQ
jgi:hypothetical protein